MHSTKAWSAPAAGMWATHSRYARLSVRERQYNQRHGSKLVIRRQPDEPVSTEIEPGRNYTKTELAAIADELLRQDARAETCRECGERGESTGALERKEQDAQDAEGNVLVLEFALLKCKRGHTWWEGEGSTRGIGGDNPILFEEHIITRRKREIYTVVGTPDPSIVAGIYNRSHPLGRRINSEEQRKRHGASYYA